METSKLYVQLGSKLGYKPVKFTQRGIIAKNILKYNEGLELNEFKQGLKKINLNTIKINEGNQTYYI